jgi:hypothetical protein
VLIRVRNFAEHKWMDIEHSISLWQYEIIVVEY